MCRCMDGCVDVWMDVWMFGWISFRTKDFSRGAMSLFMVMRIWIIYFSLLQISFVGLKKLFVQKKFGLEKTLGPKKFWSRKIWVGKIFQSEKILRVRNFWLKSFWV